MENSQDTQNKFFAGSDSQQSGMTVPPELPSVEVPSVEATTPATETQDDQKETSEVMVPKAEVPEVDATQITEDLERAVLEKLGISADEIKAAKELKKAKEEPTQEDKQFIDEEKSFAELVEFGISSKKVTKEEIAKYREISKSDDKDIVFNSVASEMKSEDPEVTDDEIEAEFNRRYFVEDFDENIKRAGTLMIKEDAQKIKSPILSKVEAVKGEFVVEANVKGYIDHQKVIAEEFLKHQIKKTVNIGDEEIEVSVSHDFTFDDLKKHFQSEEGKAQNYIIFGAFVQDRQVSERVLGGLITQLATAKSEQKLFSAIAEATYKKAQEEYNSKLPGVTAPFTRKESVAGKKVAPAVDETEQWKKYNDRTS